MADASDDPRDIVAYWRMLCQGYECVFGSRFIRGAEVVDYPPLKLLLNRLSNTFIAILFGLRYNDMTNAFKCFRREALTGIRPDPLAPLQHHRGVAAQGHRSAATRGR